ncbi:CPBP family intramembrane glutamic endopeptidase [Staphylococcus durrellii]|uniref:CPBP family intramembrane glutamic endopeptidase n=1 Tax=Staphylococcus durrellii TaxID=2781773 RepID=UPI00189EB8FF|nr:CPBP family intramembrane glutamic endopeptidase [Staphylococcus durrellii]MBF7016406.1 CPBP family intramembrane metalloprotease [Staphylococcus durrellii]
MWRSTRYTKVKINKIDFLVIPILIIAMIVFVLLGKFYSGIIMGHLTESQHLMLGAFVQLLAYVTTIICYWLLKRNEFVTKLNSNYNYIKAHWKFIMIVFVVTYFLSYLYNSGVQYLPGDLAFSETQNEIAIQGIFSKPFFLPITFLLIVIAGPFIEELFFRHLLIGELGKKFNFKVMGVISVISFSMMHVTSAASPLEFGSYCIIAIGIVYAYLKSGKKLGVSVCLHMLNNLSAFIVTILM